MMNRYAWIVLVALAGCAKTGTVVEKTPVTQDLSAYHSASIAVEVDASIENPDVQKSQLSTFLEKNLRDKKLFSDVVADGGDLAIKIKITKLDKPTTIAGVPGGSSDMSGSVELFDSKASKAIGAFDVTGTSSRSTSTSIGGVNTNTGEDPRKRALQAAADQIAEFIESHSGKK
jgi:hypothetical protein